MSEQKGHLYEFDSFRLDALKRQLSCNGQVVPLTSKAFETLLVLVKHRGETVSKDELMNFLWSDVAVEENNLTQQISTLRKALGDCAGNHRFIITIPGRGYSFVAPLKTISDIETESEVLLQEITHSSITIDVSDDKIAETQSEQSITKPNRFKAPSTFRARAFALAASLLVLVSVAAFWLKSQRELSSPPSTPRTIAVLPFKSLNAGGNDDFFGSGMSDT